MQDHNRKKSHAMGSCGGRGIIVRALIGSIGCGLVLIAIAASAQTAEEHASHHPGAPGEGAAAGMASGAPAGPPSPAGTTGGMGAMMAPASPAGGCMGGGCGSGGVKTAIYPTLMTLPALTPEKRAAIDALASQQMNEGVAQLTKGSQVLEQAGRAGDEASKQQAVVMMHEGLNQLEAGIAARRVLSEGKAPRNLALDWFKREMSLASPVTRDEPGTHPDLSPLHLLTMALLIAFAFAMLAVHFFKMRRAAALFGRLEPDAGSPPPGSSPPLSGAPGPTVPPASNPPAGDLSTPAVGKPPTPAAAGQTLPAGASTQGAGGSSTADSTASPTTPLTAKWKGHLRVASIVNETPAVKTYRLCSSGDGDLPITYIPGQFLNVAFAVGGARMNRSYSISSSPNARDYVELTVKRENRGAVSRHIHDLVKDGDEIEAGGPVGTFTFTGSEADSIVLIAAGVGITPMMSIARYLTERSWPGDIYFIYSCRTSVDFIFAKAISTLEQRNPRLHVVVTMSDPGPEWKGPKGRITKELLTQSVPDLASRRIHLCGPPGMMDTTKALLTEIGVPPNQLKTEAFGAVKPPPVAPGTSAKPTAPATGPLVTFSTNNKSAKTRSDQTILELSEELGIGIEFSCRVGTCGVCKVKMTTGEVDMAVEDALDDDDKKNGLILACQAKAKGEVTVEA